MALSIKPAAEASNPTGQGFAGLVSGVDLRRPLLPVEVAAIDEGMERFAVLAFRDQPFTDDEQLTFTRQFGPLEGATEYSRDTRERRLHRGIVDTSNLDKDGKVLERDDPRLMNTFGARRWHTDSSYKAAPAKYSFLSARSVPGTGGETQFADMRAAYDALSADLKAMIDPLMAEHSIAHSRAVIGFVGFVENDLPPVQHPLVRCDPKTGRKSLFLSSHISHIVGMPRYESIDLLTELQEFATQPRFVYTHSWKLHDLVAWDNRVTMHRGRRYDTTREPRDMRRTTVEGVKLAA